MACGGSDKMWLAEKWGPRTPTMLMLAKGRRAQQVVE